MTTAAAEDTGKSPGTNQGTQRPAAASPTHPRKGSKHDDDDVQSRIKKEMAEAVKNNQAAVDETEEDEDAPEPMETTEYPEGDADAGAINPDLPTRPIAQRDRRAYLIRQAERNEAANDQLNAMQVAANKKVGEVTAYLQDPDYMRETSMQTAVTALKAHDPDEVQKRHDAQAKMQKAREDREKKNGAK
jgi:hypothetical protein